MAVVARYLVDTSVWARRRQASVRDRLVPLISAGLVATCSVLDAEALYSTRTSAEYEELRQERHDAYEFLVADQEIWDRALEVQRQLAARSMTRAVGIPDLLIAAVAERHRVVVLHYDADFEYIAAITGQRTEWIAPSGSLS